MAIVMPRRLDFCLVWLTDQPLDGSFHFLLTVLYITIDSIGSIE
jgi:hypothetical protein